MSTVDDVPDGEGASALAAKTKKRTGLLAALLVLVLLFAIGMQLVSVRARIAMAQGERSTLTEQLARQRQENRSLEASLERADDPEYLQQLAREQLGMVSPGEKDFYDVSN